MKTFKTCSNKKSLANITLMEFEKGLEEKRQGLSEKAQQQRGLITSDETCTGGY